MTERRIVITQGEHAASGDPDVVITTVLGSCVAVCLWDHLARIGGMNHILLASQTERDMRSDMAGMHAMELLINALLKLGATRERLQAKVFGGAQMVSGLSGIGASNAAFTLDFLARENIACIGRSLGGHQARRLLFWPVTGTVRQKSGRNEVPEPKPVLPTALPTGNGLELF